MTQSEHPSNSRKDREKSSPVNLPKSAEKKSKKEIKKVVTGEVIQKKPSIGTRFKETFFSDDIGGVGRFIVLEVLLPAARNLVVDTVNKGIERAIYGETASRRRMDPTYRYSYNRSPINRDVRYADLPDQPRRPTHAPRERAKRQAVGDILLPSNEEADLVLERLTDIVDNYDTASIADLYDLLGLPHTYIDNKWGWDDLRDADVRQVREGYLIILPPAEPID